MKVIQLTISVKFARNNLEQKKDLFLILLNKQPLSLFSCGEIFKENDGNMIVQNKISAVDDIRLM